MGHAHGLFQTKCWNVAIASSSSLITTRKRMVYVIVLSLIRCCLNAACPDPYLFLGTRSCDLVAIPFHFMAGISLTAALCFLPSTNLGTIVCISSLPLTLREERIATQDVSRADIYPMVWPPAARSSASFSSEVVVCGFSRSPVASLARCAAGAILNVSAAGLPPGRKRMTSSDACSSRYSVPRAIPGNRGCIDK